MNRRMICVVLALMLMLSLLTGCGDAPVTETTVPTETEVVETTAPTVPADGNPNDVTCKGSYTADEIDSGAVAASIGDAKLTNGQLQVYYWMEVAAYQAAEHEIAPNFDEPLDTQPCEIDDSVNSWQQYFLRRALNTWHTSQALALQSVDEGIPTEEAYQPNESRHEEYMTGMPANAFLYGYNNNYIINTMHQAYLDSIPDMLEQLAADRGFADAAVLAENIAGASEEDLQTYAALYNTGYMYFTSLSYYFEPAEEEVAAFFEAHEEEYTQAGITADSGRLVDIRNLLVVPTVPVEEPKTADKEEDTEPTTAPETVVVNEDGTVVCSEALWEACFASAQELMAEYQASVRANSFKTSKTTEDALFADLANKNSDDSNTALDGGLYQNLRKGQLTEVLDEWCFDESRQYGDVEILRSEMGYHILFFRGSTELWYAAAEADLKAEMGAQKMQEAREKYPADIDYGAISLSQPARTGEVVTASDLLYSDVAHQRYPEAHVYLQQDYPNTMYGAYKITTHGCGITTMAMLATYMSDTELTPPTLCARYGSYCYRSGTDGSLFNVAPAEMGFYLKFKTYDWREAKAAMEEGYVVVTVQRKGYWTGGGHYLLLEKMFDDDTIQVRDSNIFNYGRLKGHKEDRFAWTTIPTAGYGYWIYENKVVTIPACTRCGGEAHEDTVMLTGDYICEKCEPAILRRDTYLTYCGD